MKRRWMALTAAALLAASMAVAQDRVPTTPPDDDDPLEALAFEDEAGEGGGPMMQMEGMGGGGGMHGRRGMRGAPGMRMRHGGMANLNLTDEQRTKMADIHDRSARRAIPIRSNLQIAELDLRKLLREDKPAKSAVDSQIDKISKLRGDLQKSRMQAMLEARDILTPEQRSKMHGRGGSGGGKDSD